MFILLKWAKLEINDKNMIIYKKLSCETKICLSLENKNFKRFLGGSKPPINTINPLIPKTNFLPAVIKDSDSPKLPSTFLSSSSSTSMSVSSSSVDKNQNTQMPKMNGNFTSTADKVTSSNVKPSVGVQKGVLFPSYEISKEQKLINEAVDLGLVTYDNPDNAGETKLSKLGISVYNKVSTPEIVKNYEPNPSLSDPAIKYEVGLLYAHPDNLIVVPSQTHYLLLVNQITHQKLALGVFTSKKAKEHAFISNFQIDNPNKKQYLLFFPRPKIVNNSDYTTKENGKEFLEKTDVVKNITKSVKLNFPMATFDAEIYTPLMLTYQALEKMIVFVKKQKDNLFDNEEIHP